MFTHLRVTRSHHPDPPWPTLLLQQVKRPVVAALGDLLPWVKPCDNKLSWPLRDRGSGSLRRPARQFCSFSPSALADGIKVGVGGAVLLLLFNR